MVVAGHIGSAARWQREVHSGTRWIAPPLLIQPGMLYPRMLYPLRMVLRNQFNLSGSTLQAYPNVMLLIQ